MITLVLLASLTSFFLVQDNLFNNCYILLCRHRTNLEDDVYNFGFILLESLVGPIVTGKGEAFLLNEMVS